MPRVAPYGYCRHQLTFPVVLPAGTGAAGLLPAITPGFAFEVEKAWYVPTVAATGASGSRVITVLRGSTAVATRTLVLADADTVGTDVPAFTVTAGLPFDDDDTLAISVAAGGTAFTAGSGYIVVQVRELAQRER
jgi:hypothetical protein